MLETFQQIDIWLFHLLNSAIANPVFDKSMPFLTEIKHWTLVYIFGILLLIWKGGTKGRLVAIVLIIAVAINDYLSSHIIKDAIGRIRPCHTLDGVRLLVDCGAGKSFPSSHASNNFVMACILSYYYRQYLWAFFSVAFLMAFTRIYIGVHYPFDSLGGAAIGLILGYSLILIQKPIEKKLKVQIR